MRHREELQKFTLDLEPCLFDSLSPRAFRNVSRMLTVLFIFFFRLHENNERRAVKVALTNLLIPNRTFIIAIKIDTAIFTA